MLAAQINKTLGGFAVYPWQVGEIPEEWLIAFRGLSHDIHAIRQDEAMIERTMAESRRMHEEAIHGRANS